MRISAIIAAVALALLVAVGCGSTKTSGSPSTSTPSTSTAPPATTSTSQTAKIGGRGTEGTYRVSLSGSAEVPAGGRAATGKVTIVLLRKQQLVCWSFSNLAGFDIPPTGSDIQVGAKGRAGPVFVPLAAKFLPRACIRESSGQIAAIAKNPSGYYVNVYSKKHPKGAVRAQL